VGGTNSTFAIIYDKLSNIIACERETVYYENDRLNTCCLGYISNMFCPLNPGSDLELVFLNWDLGKKWESNDLF
jgi:hypothetical protein